MNPNLGPSGGLYARETASGAKMDPSDLATPKGAQAGTQDLDPRAVILDLIHTTLNAAGYWLPIEGQHAIADAIANLPIGVTENRTLAVRAAIHIADDHDVTDWQRGYRACAERVLAALDEQPAASHHYLSTGCLHGQHDYCQNKTGIAGPKRPAQCKFCAAPCRCACHTEDHHSELAA